MPKVLILHSPLSIMLPAAFCFPGHREKLIWETLMASYSASRRFWAMEMQKSYGNFHVCFVRLINFDLRTNDGVFI